MHLSEGVKAPLHDLVGGAVDELPPKYLKKEHYITGVNIRIRPIAKSNETKDSTVQTGFFLHFANNGSIGRFTALDKSAPP